MIKKLEESIINVYDENDKLINFSKKEIKYFKPRFSSTGKESLTLFLDDIPLTNNKKFKRKVEYKCDCGNINKILLSKFLIKEKMVCVKCRENKDKIEWHKLYFEKKRKNEIRGNKESKRVVYNFDNENDEFKRQYFERNLTYNEFNKIKKYIYSIGDYVVENCDFELLIAEPSYNSKKYRQMIKIGSFIIPFKNIFLRCPLCNKVFHITRQIKERVISNNFDCKKCFLNNKTFAIKKINGTLYYQGNFELKFINTCLKENIDIVNGPVIPYIYNNKKHLYTTDFYLPKYNMVIELKDNHIWHKKQVESGKWEKKENGAKQYCNINGLKYVLLFPNDIDTFFKTLKEIV